jgi:hypothetical protein
MTIRIPRPVRRGIAAAACSGLATSAVLVGGHAAAVGTRPPAPHHPGAAAFTHGRVDNQWFPLKPGTVTVFRGRDAGKASRDVVLATYRTRVIDGVVCRVVDDRLFLDGILREHTHDFYAQTRKGVVWYFGEHTAELDRHGHVTSREGSFESGRDGAEAGIFMPAHPQVGDSFRQEDYPGHAEDQFTVVRRGATVDVPAISSRHALLTRETTPLEPGIVDHKFYLRDIGVVLEKTVKGGHEVGRLVAIRHRPR